ncbi:MAG: methyltransferase family protein [Anaerolineae bacterium]
MSVWRQLRTIVLLPGLALVVIPAALLILTGTFNPAWGLPGTARILLLTGGLLVLAGGLLVLGHAIYLFHAIGEGTLAPWDPTRRLVIAGLYRHVRNPMYVGVLLAALAEVILAGAVWLAAWWAILVVGFNLFVRLYEEPHLRAQYGAEYAEFCANVPRWIPRLRPWQPDR